jgi:hypothetical protein
MRFKKGRSAAEAARKVDVAVTEADLSAAVRTHWAVALGLAFFLISTSARSRDEPSSKGVRAPRAPSVKASAELSGYTDTDHVDVLSPSLAATVADDVAGWSASGRYLVDVVSAASVDIVSTASGKWHEVRQAGSGALSLKRGDATLGASGGFSSEPDYLSLSAGGTLSLDLLQKNVTPFVGYTFAHDDVGRTGLPRTFWASLEAHGLDVGVTLVLGRRTIASVQANGVFERGYLAKPYRYVPLFAPGQTARIPPGASIDQVNRERLPLRPADQVPRARDRAAFSGRLAHRFDRSTLRLDGRGYLDDWGLVAATVDARVLWEIGRALTIWPHLRFHAQTGVDFWRRAYEVAAGANGQFGIPPYRTGDRELSALYTATVGAGARLRLGSDIQKRYMLVLEVDGAHTRYADALFLQHRESLFSTLGLEVELD